MRLGSARRPGEPRPESIVTRPSTALNPAVYPSIFVERSLWARTKFWPQSRKWGGFLGNVSSGIQAWNAGVVGAVSTGSLPVSWFLASSPACPRRGGSHLRGLAQGTAAGAHVTQVGTQAQAAEHTLLCRRGACSVGSARERWPRGHSPLCCDHCSLSLSSKANIRRADNKGRRSEARGPGFGIRDAEPGFAAVSPQARATESVVPGPTCLS